MFDESSAFWIYVRHNTRSDGDVKSLSAVRQRKGANKTVCLGSRGALSVELGFLIARSLFSTVVSSGSTFVTLFRTTVIETLTTPVSAILTFDRFGGQSRELCDW